ncbi:hypothetical protein [Streptomyces sp. GQFP]|uniref:hypothetical protein n=1 Tax=Streptomyces sp. GQFP TaxID=2907545 RepID=UPI001F39DF99|nr:hypothetical protein [Streptomyces sp. GQFP]UIX34292.1 hypothetical protein LUX31_32180 [Streptomyces sp. GQFP]
MNSFHIYRFAPFPLQGANAASRAPTSKRERITGEFFTLSGSAHCDLIDRRAGNFSLTGTQRHVAAGTSDDRSPSSLCATLPG